MKRGKLAVVVLALSALHCGPLFSVTTNPCTQFLAQSVSTLEVRFRDPSKIALIAGDGRVLVPAGSAPNADALGSTIVGGPWVTGKYSLRLMREVGRALSIDWQTDLPMAGGHRQVLVLPDGTFQGIEVPTGIAPGTLGFPGVLQQPNLALTLCVSLSVVHGVYTPHLVGCYQESWSRFLISTPWSNVVSVRVDTHDNVTGPDDCPTHRSTVVLYPPAGQR